MIYSSKVLFFSKLNKLAFWIFKVLVTATCSWCLFGFRPRHRTPFWKPPAINKATKGSENTIAQIVILNTKTISRMRCWLLWNRSTGHDRRCVHFGQSGRRTRREWTSKQASSTFFSPPANRLLGQHRARTSTSSNISSQENAHLVLAWTLVSLGPILRSRLIANIFFYSRPSRRSVQGSRDPHHDRQSINQSGDEGVAHPRDKCPSDSVIN